MVVVTGELPQRLVEMLLLHAEFAREAAPFISGEVEHGAPLAQLQALGQTLLALEIQVRDTLGEARGVYEAQKRAYEAERAPGLRVVA